MRSATTAKAARASGSTTVLIIKTLLYSILFPRAKLRLLAAVCAELNLYIDFGKRAHNAVRSLARSLPIRASPVSSELHTCDKDSRRF